MSLRLGCGPWSGQRTGGGGKGQQRSRGRERDQAGRWKERGPSEQHPSCPEHRDVPPGSASALGEAAHLSGPPLEGGTSRPTRGRARMMALSASSSVVPRVLALGSPLGVPLPMGHSARSPGAPQGGAGAEIQVRRNVVRARPEKLWCPPSPGPLPAETAWQPAVPPAFPGPFDGPDRRASEKSTLREETEARTWKAFARSPSASQTGPQPLPSAQVRVFPGPPSLLMLEHSEGLHPPPPRPGPSLRKLCL